MSQWQEVQLTPGMTAIDVGANVGTYSGWLWRMIGPTGHLYAIEPHAACGEQIRQDVPEATVLALALGDHDGPVTFQTCQQPVHGTLWAENALDPIGTITVPMRTLDSLIADGTLPADIDFVKVDVQGAEALMLAGARAVLARRRASWFIEIWAHGLASAGSSPKALCAVFADAGYTPMGTTWEAVVTEADAHLGHSSMDVLVQPVK